MNRHQSNELKKLKDYIRKPPGAELISMVKFNICLFSFPLAACLGDDYPIVAVVPFALLFSMLGLWFSKWVILSNQLYVARIEHRLDWLIEDFSNAQPLLSYTLNVGDEWLFGRGIKRLVEISDITALRYAPKDIWFKSDKLIATLASEEEEIVLASFTIDKLRENELGSLVFYISKVNPTVKVDEALLGMGTPAFDNPLDKKLSKRSIRGTWGTCLWAIDGEGFLTVRKGEGEPCNGKSPWEDFSPIITRARFERAVVLPQDCSGLLAGCSSLVELDCEFWDMSRVVNMKRMFCGCSSLEEVHGANWNTSQVEDMTCAFDGCSALRMLASTNWDTSSVRDMTGLFWGCSSLRFLGVKEWDTSRVEDMRNMFIGCESLVTLPLSKWDTSRTKSVNSMFMDCKSLEELDLSHWKTDKMEDLRHMFEGCTKLDVLTVSQDMANLMQGDRRVFGICQQANVRIAES